ncbi:MAG: HAAS signaling domain-containing protein [Acidimicrobiales bacterium]
MSTPRGERWVHAAANTPTNVGAAPGASTSGHSGGEDRAEVGRAERAYLDQLRDALADVPAARRDRLVAVAADHLDERPPASSLPELYDTLGTPSTYARMLRDLPASETDDRSRLARVLGSGPRRLLAATAAVVLVVGGALAIRSAGSVDAPTVSNACAGVSAAGVTAQTAAGVTEFSVRYEHNGSFTFGICPSSPDGAVRLRGVRVVAAPLALAQPAGWIEITDSAGDALVVQDPADGLDVPLSTINELIVHVEFDNCEHHSPGWTESFSDVEMDLEHGGRTFVVEVPLGYVVSVSNAAPSACPALGRGSGTIDQAAGIGGPVDAAAARDLCRFFEGVDTEQELAERALFDLPTEQRADVARAAFAADCPDEAEHLDQVLELVDP